MKPTLLLALLLLLAAGPVPAANDDAAADAAMETESADETAPRLQASAGLSEYGRYSNPSPTVVRLTLLDTSSGTEAAVQLGVLLEKYWRRDLEARMGLELEVLNISNARADYITNSVLYYRPGYLRPALILAEVMPGDQAVEPMRPETLQRRTIDIQIMVGKELP